MEQNHKKIKDSSYETKRKTPTRKTNRKMETAELSKEVRKNKGKNEEKEAGTEDRHIVRCRC